MRIAQNRPVLSGWQIRLVRIYRSHAKRPESPFAVIDLDNVPHPYMAISYVWGYPKIVAHLQCHGRYSLPLSLTASAQRLVARISGLSPPLL